MHRDGREPRPTNDHREPDAENSDRSARQRSATEECDQSPGAARERKARERTLTAERHRSGCNQAADAERGESDRSCDEVNQPNGADGGGRPHGCADRKSIHRISREKGRDDHARAEGTEEPGRGSRLWFQYTCESDGSRKNHQPGEREVCGLDPTAGTIREHAEWVSSEGESVPDERLDQSNGEVEGPCEHTVAEEGTGDRRAAVES